MLVRLVDQGTLALQLGPAIGKTLTEAVQILRNRAVRGLAFIHSKACCQELQDANLEAGTPTPRRPSGALGPVALGKPHGETPGRRAKPGSELAFKGSERAPDGQLELARFVAAVPVELIAVQRLPALGAGCECRPGLVHIHIPSKTSGSSVYSGYRHLQRQTQGQMIDASRKEDPMYARVASFEGRDMSLADSLVAKVRDRARQEDAIPGAHGFLMLIDREQGTALGITLFATEKELRAAEPAFEKMASTIPEEMRGRRVSVDIYEVLMLDGGTDAKAARLSTLEGPPEQIDSGTRRVIEDILPRVQSIDGFAGVISLADRKSGTTKLITLWTSANALTASESAATNLRSEAAKAAGGTIAGVERYEVAVAERLAKVEATV
jgi:hypothetical protein